MRKTTLALAVSTILGGLAFTAAPASAMPIQPSGIQSDAGVTQVRMTGSERMMMKKRMMRKDMMRKKMMRRKMMRRDRMMNRM